jgi:hypothetical protein
MKVVVFNKINFYTEYRVFFHQTYILGYENKHCEMRT